MTPGALNIKTFKAIMHQVKVQTSKQGINTDRHDTGCG